MDKDARYWIEKLGLVPHPEGGFFAPAYRSPERLEKKSLPCRFPSGRAFVSSIHYLLDRDSISALHRLKSVEIWHYCAGSPLALHWIDTTGNLSMRLLGEDLEQGQFFQVAIEPGCWFGAEIAGPGDFSLVSCVVVPGFDFEDFELGRREDLLATYPRHAATIEKFTRHQFPDQ